MISTSYSLAKLMNFCKSGIKKPHPGGVRLYCRAKKSSQLLAAGLRGMQSRQLVELFVQGR